MSIAFKRRVTDLSQEGTSVDTKRARVETPTYVFPQSLTDVEDSLLDLYDRADGFFEAFLNSFQRSDKAAILNCALSKNLSRCFNLIKETGTANYNDDLLDEAEIEFELTNPEIAFIRALMEELDNDVNEVVAGDLSALIDDDKDGLFKAANITEADVMGLCESLYFTRCCLWAQAPDWSFLGDEED